MKIKTQIASKSKEKDMPMLRLIKRKLGVVLLISDKNFRVNNIPRDKKGHFIMIKKSTDQENTITLKV